MIETTRGWIVLNFYLHLLNISKEREHYAFQRNPLMNTQPSLRNRRMASKKATMIIASIKFSLPFHRQDQDHKQKWCAWASTETSHFDSALPGSFSASINHHRQWEQADSKHLIIWPSILSCTMLQSETAQRKVELPFAHKLTSAVYFLQRAEKPLSLHLTSVVKPKWWQSASVTSKRMCSQAFLKLMRSAAVMPSWWRHTTKNSAQECQFQIHIWHRRELITIFTSTGSLVSSTQPIPFLAKTTWRQGEYPTPLHQAISFGSQWQCLHNDTKQFKNKRTPDQSWFLSLHNTD